MLMWSGFCYPCLVKMVAFLLSVSCQDDSMLGPKRSGQRVSLNHHVSILSEGSGGRYPSRNTTEKGMPCRPKCRFETISNRYQIEMTVLIRIRIKPFGRAGTPFRTTRDWMPGVMKSGCPESTPPHLIFSNLL
ncbi:hypothetical protein L1987_05875 [Smallanthus sonchifolius]|uniref:Uncharacterized protein n=1 Tax=Smallanthus sonchifolius TaxID=185202 RepID=A0ACB9JWJ0_9ASTR|nr:hypothetical protein L1987_05875 [Smallanthus sonchifolius]